MNRQDTTDTAAALILLTGITISSLGVGGCIAVGDSIAQVRYEGQLVEAVQGQPLSSVEVSLSDCDSKDSDTSPGDFVLTDKDGRFAIETTYWGGSIAWLVTSTGSAWMPLIPIGCTKAPPIESVCFLVNQDDRRAVKEVILPNAIDPNKAGTIDLGKIDIFFVRRPE